MPYRIDIACPPAGALDLLVDLGALDIDAVSGGLAAIMPDGVMPHLVAAALGGARISVSAASARDDGSVWLVNPGALRIGGILIAGSQAATSSSNTVTLTDSTAFGTGHHPTTALSLEAMIEILAIERPDSILDVGTGSGILALAALVMGVPRATGLDVDPRALEAAEENARLNRLRDRLRLILGGPDVVDGRWPVIVANLLAAPLIEMAPVLVRRLENRGRLILSGIRSSLECEVRQAYERLGIVHIRSKTRCGWAALIAQASW